MAPPNMVSGKLDQTNGPAWAGNRATEDLKTSTSLKTGLAPDKRRRTLVERQADAGSNDPFRSSEQVINNVGKQMSSMRAKRESVIKEIAAMTADLEFVEAQLAEAEKNFETFMAEAKFRKSEHARLTKFVHSCEERQHKISSTCRQWKRDYVLAESKHTQNTARELLQSERGFFSGPGSTLTRSQFKERSRLLKSLPRSGATQTLRPLSGDQGGFTAAMQTGPF